MRDMVFAPSRLERGGVIAAELALLVHLLLRFCTRIGVPVWRKIHWLTYAVFDWRSDPWCRRRHR